jgi:hypothetical protein
MVKVIAFSAVAILVVSSSAFAQVDLQYQGWNLGLGNSINLSGGAGTGSTTQGVGTLSVQNLGVNPNNSGVPTVTAGQGIGAALFQNGNATTDGKGNIGLAQTLGITGLGITVNGSMIPGGQTQSIADGGGSGMQYQGVSFSGTQGLTKAAGASSTADGLNIAGFVMGQAGDNSCLDGDQLSIILGGQYSTLDGQAQSVGTITTSMTTTVQQFQTGNNPVQP